MHLRRPSVILTSALLLSTGCGDGSTDSGQDFCPPGDDVCESSGGSGAAGSGGSDGSVAGSGGAVGSGGSAGSGTGSAPAGTGGASSGGAEAAGGSESSGGAANSGGDASTGGDASSGGAASGGATSTGGTSSGGSDLADMYPCDGSTAGYDVVMSGSGSNWSVSGGGQGAQSFNSGSGGMGAALGAAYGRLAGSVGDLATLLVQGNGTIDASSQIKMPSNFVLNVCGTIEVTGTATGSDRAPLYARDRTNIQIPHATVTGNPQYGMFFRSTSNVHLGEIVLNFNKQNSGLGIRYDNNPSGGGARVKGFRIDSISVKNTGGHGVETYGADGIEIGEFEGNGTHYCGLILNNSINAEVGSITCQDCADPGTGYAAFRVANSNGKDGSNFPVGTIHVGEVVARGGDRGIFSVSGSGGLTVDKFDIAETSGTPILLQNCYNTTLGAVSGAINGGEARISNDTTNTNNGTFARSSNTIIKNTVLSGGANLREDWCDATDRGNRATNVSGGSVSMCH